jgi:hypothetical protein
MRAVVMVEDRHGDAAALMRWLAAIDGKTLLADARQLMPKLGWQRERARCVGCEALDRQVAIQVGGAAMREQRLAAGRTAERRASAHLHGREPAAPATHLVDAESYLLLANDEARRLPPCGGKLPQERMRLADHISPTGPERSQRDREQLRAGRILPTVCIVACISARRQRREKTVDSGRVQVHALAECGESYLVALCCKGL